MHAQATTCNIVLAGEAYLKLSHAFRDMVFSSFWRLQWAAGKPYRLCSFYAALFSDI